MCNPGNVSRRSILHFRTKFYDKRNDFNFPIVNFPFVCSNISASPAQGLCIFIPYSSAFVSYKGVIYR